MKIDNVNVFNFKNAVIGMRNPLQSHHKMDSVFREDNSVELGENDLGLMRRLFKAGTDHRKFMRQILVSFEIEMPLYWWKQFDTYKIGTTSNSDSTMYNIHKKEFTKEDFTFEETGDYFTDLTCNVAFNEVIMQTLNSLREKYIHTKDKKIWRKIIQILPSCYNQKRTITCSYENLANMYKSRKNHKLSEWNEFCEWCESLPYFEEILNI